MGLHWIPAGPGCRAAGSNTGGKRAFRSTGRRFPPFPAAVDGPLATPPEAPAAGNCWIVDGAATGAWASEAGRLALWTAGGWRIVAPLSGMRVRRISDGAALRFGGSKWTLPIAIANPDGGTTIDLEARAAIDALLALMVAHGIMIAD
ncbi:DUF2793 domain-containing protein [Sphingopyxis sp. GC21]|uniref:DUF2793 domain-containing protein n=1 Tax=Sphingopyxis sp. GC21 TaxID=2933562 RepID=UPI0009ECED41|nr:DUF2793 domain-containing protein [Sphingopyxis sp. GC21]